MKQTLVTLGVLCLGLALAQACEPPCQESRCSGGALVEGDPSLFVLGPQEGDLIDISSPEACTRATGHRILLTTYGDNPLVFGTDTSDAELEGFDFQRNILIPELEKRGVDVHTFSFGTSCLDDQTRLVVSISDWAQANEAARGIGRAMLDHDLNDQIELQVVDEQRFCADYGCYEHGSQQPEQPQRQRPGHGK